MQMLIFQGWGGLVKLGHFAKSPTRNNFGIPSPRYSQNYILNGKFNPKMDTIRAFFPKSEHFFHFSRKGGGRPPSFSSSCTSEMVNRSIPWEGCSAKIVSPSDLDKTLFQFSYRQQACSFIKTQLIYKVIFQGFCQALNQLIFILIKYAVQLLYLLKLALLLVATPTVTQTLLLTLYNLR